MINKVTGDLLEGAGCGGVDGSEWGNSGMCVHLILLAGCTAFDVFTDVGGQARPPELGSDKLAGLQVARMSSSFIIMVTLEDGAVKGFIIGDIHRCNPGRSKCPLQLASQRGGSGREGEYFFSWNEELEDKGVVGRGGLNAMRESNINDIDKEGQGKESDSFIVIVRLWQEVGLTQEGVRACQEFSWDVNHFQIKVGEVDKPINGLVNDWEFVGCRCR